MKKLLLLCMILPVFLSGCEEPPEETGYLDYAKMDRENGQLQVEHDFGDDSVQFVDEADVIKAVVTEYVEQLVAKNVEKCVKELPYEFKKMISEQRGCNDVVAHGVAIGMIEKLFYTKEQLYRDIEGMWDNNAHEILIERIDIYSHKDTLKEIYRGYGVTILEAIDIKFNVLVNGFEKKDKVRLVKMENEEWELDLSFVENHES